MIKIEVQTKEVTLKQGTSSKTGKPYSIREQDAWGHFVDRNGNAHPHPMRIRLTLDDAQEPYSPGVYTLAAESVYPDQWGQIAIRARLRPVAAAAAQRAS